MYSFWQIVGYGIAASLGFYLVSFILGSLIVLFFGIKIRMGVRDVNKGGK